MKKFLPFFLMMFVATSFTFAQSVIFSDNFDTYTAGSHLAESNPAWTTWNNDPGSAEDGVISNVQAASAPNSLYIAGTTDQLYLTNIHNVKSGHYQITFNMFVPDGSAAYFNLMHSYFPNIWAHQCDFYADGTGQLYVNNDSVTFTYPVNTWFPVLMDFDLDQDITHLTINNTMVNTWPFHFESFNTSSDSNIKYIAALDFYSSTVWNIPCAYYIDDLVFSDLCGEFNISQESIVFFNAPDSTISHTITLSDAGNHSTNWQTLVTYDIPNPDTTSTGAEVLTHCSDNPNRVTGELAGQHEYAVKFPASMLQNHIGKTLKGISVGTLAEVSSAKVRICGMGNPLLTEEPGEVIYEQNFNPSDGYVALDTQIVIDGSDFWIDVWYIQVNSGTSILYDSLPDKGYSYWKYTYYNSNVNNIWLKLGHNLAISAYVDGTPITPWLSVNPEEGTIGGGENVDQVVTVNSNGMQIGDNYTAKLHYYSNDFNNFEQIVPVFLNVTGVSVNEHNQIEVSLYPNPATDHLQIVSDEIQRVEVYNLLGQCVFSQAYNDTHVIIPTTDLTPGTYAVTVTTRNNRVTKKVVIR